MSFQSACVRNLDPAEDELAAWTETVCVVTNAGAP
jgi:hypothetical protein